MTVDPDCTIKVSATDFDLVDHTLPSPEEQLQTVALKFPPEMVAIDVSGKSFERMCSQRRSMITGETADGFKRRTKTRRSRSKRRNTIAGTDAKEIAAIVGGSVPISGIFICSETPELGKTTPEGMSSSTSEKKSHLENLKEWGRSRLRQIKNIEPSVRLRSVSNSRRKWDKEEPNPHSSSGNWSASSESGHSTATSHIPRSSISSGSVCPKHKKPVVVSTSSSVTSESTTLTPDDGETCSMYSCDTEGYYTSFHLDSGLKTLREEEPCTPIHCTSALSVNSQVNQSAAESEYELFGKGSTSTTASSAGTVCTTLLVPPTAPTVPERVSSQLSGNKTLPERTTRSHDTINTRETQSLKLNKKSDAKMLTFDEVKHINESKDSSKFNIEEKNCVITVDVHHEHRNTSPEKCGDSPDSGHNTCSSPVDSIASPSLDLEMSECSDLEGVDRMERIRVKTTINSSRIPSMCVITPPQSDDEVSLNQYNKSMDSGEYVTIADVRPTNPTTTSPKYNTISPIIIRESEYVSLNDLPSAEGLAEPKRQGARVTLNAEGKVVYSSDSLRRRKAVHTTGTFEPGPCVTRSDNSPVPQRQTNVRPVIAQSPLFANRKTITPSPVQKTPPSKSPVSERKDTSLRQPLTTVSTNRAFSPSGQKRMTTSTNQKQYFSQSTLEKQANNSSRPLSPLVSPTTQNNKITIPNPIKSPTRAASPRMIVKATTSNRALSPEAARGAYVNMNQMAEDSKFAIKRSDSYRLANEETVFNPNLLGRKQYGPGVIAGPSLLSAIQAARTNKAAQETSLENNLPLHNTSVENILGSGGQSTWPRSTSTPTKSNVSSSMDFSATMPSPIQKSATPPRNSRSAMDLYAVIHESKKRIQNLQKPIKQSPIWPKSIPAKSVSPIPPEASVGLPQPMAPLTDVNQLKYTKQSTGGYGSLPRLQVQKLEQSPRNLARKSYTMSRKTPPVIGHTNQSLASDRHGPIQPTSRTDFKKLLLQTGWSTPQSIGKESAVERLRNRTPTKPLRYDVLSSTIPEDCDDEEEHTPTNTSKANSNNSLNLLSKNPTLETAL
ncbi:NHS actin remodeling regulator GUK-holder isoform X3 [Rhodnius prolixus]